MRKPTNILLIAIVLGALSAALIYRHLRGLRIALEEARRAAVQVVVARDRIPIGSRIEAYQLQAVPWPSDILPEGVFQETSPVVGKVVRTTVEKNQPLMQAQLLSEGRGLLPLLITEGMRAMSVKVDDVTGVSGFITPSSRVDVLAAGSPDSNGANRESHGKVILQNVKVLATGKSIEQRDNKPVEVPTVTLLVTPEEAEKLTLATRRDPIRLALRNFEDEAIVRTSGASGDALFGGVARGGTPRNAIQVIRGDQITWQTPGVPEEADGGGAAPHLWRNGGGNGRRPPARTAPRPNVVGAHAMQDYSAPGS